MLVLENVGPNAFDLHTRSGGYCGTISQSPRGHWSAYFNMATTKGSKRRFASAYDAVAFIVARRAQRQAT